MFWRKPPPEPIYKRRPIASIAVVLSMIGMFVLGPVGAIYNGMTEELKGKADNATVILLIEQIKENDKRQWEEIKSNRQQTTISAPKNAQIVAPKVIERKKKLTPTEYVTYTKMTSEQQESYRKYRTDITLWPK